VCWMLLSSFLRVSCLCRTTALFRQLGGVVCRTAAREPSNLVLELNSNTSINLLKVLLHQKRCLHPVLLLK
jgi:hypothetical protein